jgi:7-carboxy-7-deazaguanine synthase
MPASSEALEMLISEIFYSIQGEGELTGMPSVFIRTSGCNLRCRWCDTPYASWKPEGTNMDCGEIIRFIEKYPSKYVVLTGGEPMIQKEIHHLCRELKQAGYHITIETAATVDPDGILCDLASLSPKLNNSTPDSDQIGDEWVVRHENTRANPQVFDAWVKNYPYQIKYVVSTEEDADVINAMHRLIYQHYIPKSKVMLMPEGITPEELKGRQKWLVDFCKEHGYRYCNRLHVDLFGNTRGT